MSGPPEGCSFPTPTQELLARGCVFQERQGWERPGWFTPKGTAPVSRHGPRPRPHPSTPPHLPPPPKEGPVGRVSPLACGKAEPL